MSTDTLVTTDSPMTTERTRATRTRPSPVRAAMAALLLALLGTTAGVVTSAEPASTATNHPGWTTYTLNLNKSETKFVARNGWAAAAGAGLLPGWAKVTMFWAGWATQTANNAVSDHKCMRLTYYYGWNVTYPSTYSGGDCH